MMSRCIWEISTNMKPSPIPPKKTSKGALPLQDRPVRRQDQGDEHAQTSEEHDGDQQGPEHGDRLHVDVVELLTRPRPVEDVVEAQGMEEERTVVRGSGDVDGELREEFVEIGA